MVSGLSAVNSISSLKVAHQRGSLGYLHEANNVIQPGPRSLMAHTGLSPDPGSACDVAERRRYWTTVAVYLAAIVERADEQILPALYYFVGISFGATPSQLGIMTLARAIMQACTSPLSGALGDSYNRGQIIAAGCFLWGMMTAAMGVATTFYAAVFFSAWNGLGLSLVIPSSQSLIADYYPARMRGKAFGLLYMIGSFGGMIAGMFATNVGGTSPYGIEGWRFAYFSTAAVSIVTGVLVLSWAVDPRRTVGAPGSAISSSFSRRITNSMWVETEAIFRIRSFQIIILQGIAGAMPWFAFGYLTLYFQLLGYSDWHASLLVAMFGLSSAIGSFVGGFLGDVASVYDSDTGRINVAQVSTGFGIMLSIVLLRLLPHKDVETYYASYMAVLILMGLTVSWAPAACIGPVFSEIVPEHLRSMIYAYDRCMEVAIAACATPVVGLIAEYFYGYEGPVARKQANMPLSSVDAERHSHNADALGNALLISLLIPWVFSLVCYGLLYRSYPKDKQKLILPEVFAKLPPIEL